VGFIRRKLQERVRTSGQALSGLSAVVFLSVGHYPYWHKGRPRVQHRGGYRTQVSVTKMGHIYVIITLRRVFY
jgi:hypothetical protein